MFDFIERKAESIGEKCDEIMDDLPPRKQYLCQVLMRVPLFFIIHQWLLVSPYSNYWIFDLFLFFVRYGVTFILVGAWTLNTSVLLQVYADLGLDLAVIWLNRVNYWSYQDEAFGICHDKNVFVWSDVTDNWRIYATSSTILKVVYIFCRPRQLTLRMKETMFSWMYIALLSLVVPEVLCVLGIFPSSMSELSYWIQSALMVVVCILEIGSSVAVDTNVFELKLKACIVKQKQTNDEHKIEKYQTKIQDLQEKIKIRKQGGNYVERFPGKRFVKDTLLMFGVTYFLVAVVIEIIFYERLVTSLLMLDTYFEMLAIWCTSLVVVLFIAYGYGILSNLIVALCQCFLTIEITINDVFHAHVVGIVQTSAVIAFTEANILSLEIIEKIEAMKMVAFLLFYAILFQTHNILEQKIRQVVDRQRSSGLSFHLRVGLLTGILLIFPTLITVSMSKHLDINIWLLFFASGNCTLIFGTLFMLLESALLSLTWYVTSHLDKLENLLHYTRLMKNLGLVILNAVQSYCRYICPFFKGWWLLRLSLSVLSCVATICLFGIEEFKRYKDRKALATLLDNLPGVIFKSQTEENGEENTECAICYSLMTDGKVLTCNHIFHKDCLRRWFQVKVTCPLCNQQITQAT